MKNIYKPLILGISLAMAMGSSNAHAKQSLVKNVVKHASPKQHADQDDEKVDKPEKHSLKQVAEKLHGSKLIQAEVVKSAAKQQVAVKSRKAPEVVAKAEKVDKAEKADRLDKSVAKQILARHQDAPRKTPKAEKQASIAEQPRPVVVAAVAPSRPVRKIERNIPIISNSVASKRGGQMPHEVAKIPHDVDKGDVYISAALDDVGKDATVYNGDSNTDNETPFRKNRSTFYKVKRGDTIPSIFQALNLNTYDLHKIVHNRKLSRQFSHLIPGKTLSISTNARGELTSLAYKSDSLIELESNEDTVAELKDQTPIEAVNSIERIAITENAPATGLGQIKHVSAHVLVQSSLEHAARNAGLPSKITKQLTDIFAWDIDFSENLRPNDQFTVVYEKIFENGRAVDTGDIVAAEFINQGERHQAVRYKDDSGAVSYYTPEGEGMHRAFLRNPLDFVKVSSYFNPSRRHPVLNRIRAHKGVDYAASTGTPIKTTGDGRVAYKGVKGGYGRVVMIEHGNEYTTLYAHMSDYADNLSEGDLVKQGQVIGYVGESGLATGPHLHYEFLVNGVHKNPLTVSLPHSQPINAALLSYFKTQARPLLAQLDMAKTTMLARNNGESDLQE